MTRKDYIRLARALHDAKPQTDSAGWATWSDMCYRIADALQADNYRFQRAKFLAACVDGC